MKLGDEANDIVFQRVHRLGKTKLGVAPNGQPWRPRPIIASFRDDKIKEKVLGLVGNIAGTPFRVSVDYLAEIRSARGRLWKKYRDAREAKMAAKIAYPAKLVINGNVVRDEFPGWSQAISGTTLEPVANRNAIRPLRPNGLFRDIAANHLPLSPTLVSSTMPLTPTLDLILVPTTNVPEAATAWMNTLVPVHSSQGGVRCALSLQMTTPRLLPTTCPILHQPTWPPTNKKRMTMADMIPRQHPKMQSCPRSPKPYHLPWIQH